MPSFPIKNHESKIENSPGPLYRAVWRWHFFAGLFVAPFALFLALTGALYLWKPQYEAWRYRELLTRSVAASVSEWMPVPADTQLAAARAAAPAGWRVQSFQPAFTPNETAVAVFKPTDGGSAFGPGLNVYLDPKTGTVVGQLRESETLMQTVKELHGSLLAGRVGKYVVELVASWALVLFLTGLYLAWPRPRFRVWGFLLPRLRTPGRTFWRDLHAVPAVWFSFATVFMLSTGLLWTQGAGTWYRTLSTFAGQGTPRESNAGAHRSALTGWSPPLKAGFAEKIDQLGSTPSAAADTHAGHAGHEGHPPAPSSRNLPLPPDGPFESAISLDHVIALANDHRVPIPYVIALPVGPPGVFSVLSDRNQPFKRVYLHLDQYSANVLAEVRFKDFGYLAQFFSWGIVAHEGTLFGLANQILGTVAALGVALLCVSGVILWWQRRPVGKLAAPPASAPLPRPILFGTLALAALLPLLAATLPVVFILDRFIGRRLETAPKVSEA